MATRKGSTKAVKRYADALYTAIVKSGGSLCPTCHNYMAHTEPCDGWDAILGAGRLSTWAVIEHKEAA